MKNLCIVNVGEFEDLTRVISKVYSEELYNIYAIDDTDYLSTLKKYFKKLKFHDFTEISRLNFLNDKFASFNVNSNQLEHYLKYLDIFFDICDRYDFNNCFTSSQRTLHYYHLLNYFEEFVNENNIEEIIFNHTPHHINTFCFYLVCKKKNIKIKINTQFSFGDNIRFTIDDDIFERCKKIKESVKINFNFDNQLNKENILKKFNYKLPKYMIPKTGKKIKFFGLNYDSLIFLFLRDLIEVYRLGLIKPAKYYLKIDKRKFFFEENKFSNLKSFFLRSMQRLKILKLKIYYNLNCTSYNELKDKKYCVFFPNYQPEATTSPSSRFYSNIFLVLENIQSVVGNDCIILFKEHPSTFNYNLESFFKRDKFFYRSLKKRFKNLKFINLKINNEEILKNSTNSFCQTSNVAIDSLKASKPVIIFGNVWFDKFYNIYKFQNIEDSKNYLNNFNFDMKLFENEIANYNYSIEKNSYNLNFNSQDDEKNLLSLLC